MIFKEGKKWVDEQKRIDQNKGQEKAEGERNVISAQIIRFLIHFGLYLRSINELKEEESTELEEIIEYYIDYLILQHKNEKKKQIKIANSKSKLTMEKARSVALYTSQIKNQAKQIEIYSNFLSEIEGDDENEKKMYWDFAIHAKLPCNVIANRIVEKKTNSNFVNSLASIQFQNKPSDDDLQRLYSLQWLCLHPSQRSDALLKANQLLSYFFCNFPFPFFFFFATLFHISLPVIFCSFLFLYSIIFPFPFPFIFHSFGIFFLPFSLFFCFNSLFDFIYFCFFIFNIFS